MGAAYIKETAKLLCDCQVGQQRVIDADKTQQEAHRMASEAAAAVQRATEAAAAAREKLADYDAKVKVCLIPGWLLLSQLVVYRRWFAKMCITN